MNLTLAYMLFGSFIAISIMWHKCTNNKWDGTMAVVTTDEKLMVILALAALVAAQYQESTQ